MDDEIKFFDSLPSLHVYLRAAFKNPPSYPTLKRWSAAGHLKSAQVIRPMSRPKYERNQAVAAIRTIWDLDGKAATEPAAAGHASQVPTPMDGATIEVLQVLVTQVEKNSRAIETLTQSVTQLNSIRTMLMNKYDAVNTQQIQTIEGLRQKIHEMNETASLSRDIQSLRIAVAKLTDSA